MGRCYDGHRIYSTSLQKKLQIHSRVACLLAAEEIANDSSETNSNIQDPADEEAADTTYYPNSPEFADGPAHSAPSTSEAEWSSDDDESYCSDPSPTPCSYEDNDDLDILGFWDDESTDSGAGREPHAHSVVAHPLPTEENLPLFGNGIRDDPEFTLPEIAMIDLLTLCDSSGARRGLYDDLLTILRRHSKKGFSITQAKGREAFLRDMKKKVPIPQPKTTKISS